MLGGALTGPAELLRERIFPFMRCGGPALSAFNAWVLAKGLETLQLRVQAMSAAADSMAAWLPAHPQVEDVRYPYAAAGPQGDLARRQQSAGGGVVSVTVRGGREAAFRAINAMQLFSITANFGDTKSTVCHPASTTHSRLEPEQRAATGIGEGLIRISAGLEDPADLRADLERGLAAI